MPKDKALKLALDYIVATNKSSEFWLVPASNLNNVVTAIKEALAQPEQEPVAWEQFYPDIGKPQLGQEPVAIYRAGQAKGEGFHVEFLKEMGDDEALLYTTPPKRPWVELTEANMEVLIEQARVVPNQVPCPDYNERLLMLTNAVLKELNT